MPYITFFDLIGTKGACDNPQLYYKNICAFEKAIKDNSWLLKSEGSSYGKVGIFSDSAYAESSDLEYLLDFLVNLRNRLISEELFFNAVIKKGELGVQPVNQTNGCVAFGVSFKKSDIADLFIAQTKFKGIGIYIDDSIYKDVEKTNYRMNDCFFVEQKNDGKYYPTFYKDIAFNQEKSYKVNRNMIKLIIQTAYSSYIRSRKFGAYYISLLSNIVRSCEDNFDWDLKKLSFSEAPISFKLIYALFSKKECYSELNDFPGLEYLIFILLDVIYNSKCLNDGQKNSITLYMSKLNCFKSFWRHSLNDIPSGLFTTNEGLNNRERLINYCKEDMSAEFIEQL